VRQYEGWLFIGALRQAVRDQVRLPASGRCGHASFIDR